ncbi:MAG TPA: YdeI/OmpD-associated family protein [Actinopolymorphaceae bacterium]
MGDPDDALVFADAAAWETWLSAHHDDSGGVWLKIAKRGSGRRSTVTVSEALDVALCYGWIDSQRRALDDSYYRQRYTPRRRTSSWSKVNVEKVEALIAAGRMRAPGLAQVEAAKADGRWDAAYESQRRATVPPDLAAALEQHPRAREFFDRLDRTGRYLSILRLTQARTPKGRAARLQRIIATLEAGERVT